MSGHTEEIPEWPGYAVTFTGEVYSLSDWRGRGMRRMDAHLDRQGYQRVRLTSDGKRKNVRVHQVVMRVYGEPKPSPIYEIRHLDGNPANNHITNLAWGTRQDNADDREAHGRTSRGWRHSEAIRRGRADALTQDEIDTVIMLAGLGWSQRRIAAEVGRSQSGVGHVIRRRA